MLDMQPSTFESHGRQIFAPRVGLHDMDTVAGNADIRAFHFARNFPFFQDVHMLFLQSRT